MIRTGAPLRMWECQWCTLVPMQASCAQDKASRLTQLHELPAMATKPHVDAPTRDCKALRLELRRRVRISIRSICNARIEVPHHENRPQ